MNPALAIAQKDLLVRDKSVPFRACVFPLAFGLASLTSGPFWCRALARTQRRTA
jgi:hypothetical protein